MVQLHEYQGKATLAAYGFKIPRGQPASTADQAVAVAHELCVSWNTATICANLTPFPNDSLNAAGRWLEP